MKKMFISLLEFFKFNSKIDNVEVRRILRYYFHECDWPYQTTITKVETFKTSKGLLIEIETHRPGLLIGKGGEFIDGLEKYLKKALHRTDITINLIESKLWYNLY